MKLNNFWNKGPIWQMPAEGTPAATQVETPTETPADYSFLPEQFRADGKPDVDGFTSHYQELVATDAQRREAAATIPEGDYEFAIPEDLDFGDLTLPEGFTVNLDTENPVMQPLFAELSGMLKGFGAPGDAGKQVSGLLAKYEAAKESQQYSAWTEDMKTLGTPAQISARVARVQRSLETRVPADQAKALFSGDRISAAGIKALEKILGPTGLQTPTPTPATSGLEGKTPFERLRAINAAQTP